MKTLIWLGTALALVAGGCSNDSGTTGPQTMPVELDVRVVAPFHPPDSAQVIVQNMSTKTDTSGLAVFHTDINTLIPNQIYPIRVNANGLVQAFPESDTVIVPGAPNQGSAYLLFKTIQMKPR